jgi:CubicO group peptidase (beta-lactamase class C family)
MQIPVTINDRFHIGSDSKAFTSLLTWQFVEAGKPKWSSTPADVFPELTDPRNLHFALLLGETFLASSRHSL